MPRVIRQSPFLKISDDNRAIVQVPSVAGFLIEPDGNATFRPAPGARLFEVETIFLAAVAALILRRRGHVPLHASCVAVRSGAIAIAGPPASGKSALAAELIRRGAKLLTDDICALHALEPAPRVRPGLRRLRLWPDLLDRLNYPTDARLPVRQRHEKAAVDCPVVTGDAPPLRCLIRLGSLTPSPRPTLEPLRGAASLMPPSELLCQPGWEPSSSVTEFRTLAALAGRVPSYLLRPTRNLDHLDHCARLVLDTVGGAA